MPKLSTALEKTWEFDGLASFPVTKVCMFATLVWTKKWIDKSFYLLSLRSNWLKRNYIIWQKDLKIIRNNKTLFKMLCLQATSKFAKIFFPCVYYPFRSTGCAGEARKVDPTLDFFFFEDLCENLWQKEPWMGLRSRIF